MMYYKLEFAPNWFLDTVKDLADKRKREAVFHNMRGTVIMVAASGSDLDRAAMEEGTLMTESSAKENFIDPFTLIGLGKVRCVYCSNRNLARLPFKSYDHDEGWYIQGKLKPQWCYYQCGNCGGETSWDKLGIPRGSNYEEPVKS